MNPMFWVGCIWLVTALLWLVMAVAKDTGRCWNWVTFVLALVVALVFFALAATE